MEIISLWSSLAVTDRFNLSGHSHWVPIIGQTRGMIAPEYICKYVRFNHDTHSSHLFLTNLLSLEIFLVEMILTYGDIKKVVDERRLQCKDGKVWAKKRRRIGICQTWTPARNFPPVFLLHQLFYTTYIQPSNHLSHFTLHSHIFPFFWDHVVHSFYLNHIMIDQFSFVSFACHGSIWVPSTIRHGRR